jgi:hypothetical protein
VRPRLIQPVEVEVRQIDTENTVYDEQTRAPVGQVLWQDPVVLHAQVYDGDTDRARAQMGGIREESEGHLTFLAEELDAAGVTLARGDRISKIAGRETDLYIERLRYAGHYTGPNSTLLLVFWEDRRPTRDR